ncbi:MAG: hypothetical protein ABR905_06420 [Terracidiphilus sp.]|jgi:hypothetical protein
MNRFWIVAALFASLALSGSAQSLADLNIELHGYVTQGFLYTNQNNIFSTDSTSGSPAWDEAVLNVTAAPTPKLRVGMQARYFLLGTYGNAITLDWAAADYKFDDRFGVRFGKVKTPIGLLNEIQDLDPTYIWSLLPQSVYPLLSRNSTLSHYGGVLYGTLGIGQKGGDLDYRVFGGEQIVTADDPSILEGEESSGITLPNGWGGTMWGATLRWKAPLQGLMIGSSDMDFPNTWSSEAIYQGSMGTQTTPPSQSQWSFARYEKKKVMAAFEYSRQQYQGSTQFPSAPSGNSVFRSDPRGWYAMASYKFTEKLEVGAYDSQIVDHQLPLGPPRFSKDWTISARYDFNQFLYAKAEQHFIDGTNLDFSPSDNVNGINPDTRLSILKIGVSF